MTTQRSSSAATAGFRFYACTLSRRCGCLCGLPTPRSWPPCLGQCLATTITSARPTRAGAVLPLATMYCSCSTGAITATTNAGSGASAMRPSAGWGLFLRIWSNSRIFIRCIVAFLLLHLFVDSTHVSDWCTPVRFTGHSPIVSGAMNHMLL